MIFTINIDTGNIEKDVLTTIKNFSNEEMQQFISAIKLKNDNSEIKGTSIFFRYLDSQQFLASVKEPTSIPIEIRTKIRKRTHRLDSDIILKAINNPNEIKSENLKEIIEIIKDKIDVTKQFTEALSNAKYSQDFYNLCLLIISSDEYFNKFINYNQNTELFGVNITQKEYIIEISKMLGYQEKEINLNNPIYQYLSITDDMKQRYHILRELINVDIILLGDEVFNQEGRTSYSKERQKEVDSDWKVNPKLMEYIMSDMNPTYNDLEQISHIYLKLCLALRYSLSYHIKSWKAIYDKNRQESITPERNKIVCSEFSLLCTNIINNLCKNIEARCIITGKEQHLLVGILDKENNIRINLDSTKVDNEFDDLARVKLGLPLVGIKIICDRSNKFEAAFKKVYDKLCEQNRVETATIIDAYDKLRGTNKIKIDFYENMNEFLKRMRERNVFGSELLGAFKRVLAQGYFGKITYSIIGQDKKLTFPERQLLETPQAILDGLETNIIIKNGEDLYLLNLNKGEIIKMDPSELNALFDEDKMAYFNQKYKIEGIGKGVSK